MKKLFFGAMLAALMLLAVPGADAARGGGGMGGGAMSGGGMGGGSPGMGSPGRSTGSMTPGGQMDQDRDRDRLKDQDMDKARDRDQDRDRLHQTDTVYGAEVMTPAEINQYRQQIRNANTVEERNRLIEQHRAEVNARARERGVTLKGDQSRVQEKVQERSRELNEQREQVQERQRTEAQGDDQ